MQHLNNNMPVINKTMYSIYSIPVELNHKPETLFIFILSETKHSSLKKKPKKTKSTHTQTPRYKLSTFFLLNQRGLKTLDSNLGGVHHQPPLKLLRTEDTWVIAGKVWKFLDLNYRRKMEWVRSTQSLGRSHFAPCWNEEKKKAIKSGGIVFIVSSCLRNTVAITKASSSTQKRRNKGWSWVEL